jgi:hypothetical protein
MKNANERKARAQGKSYSKSSNRYSQSKVDWILDTIDSFERTPGNSFFYKDKKPKGTGFF